MTQEEQILKLETRVNNLEIQVNRLMCLMEQQYEAMNITKDIIAKTTDTLEQLYKQTSSNNSYIAGQIDRNSGR